MNRKQKKRNQTKEMFEAQQNYDQTVKFVGNVLLGYGMPLFKEVLNELQKWNPYSLSSNYGKMILVHLITNTLFADTPPGKETFTSICVNSQPFYDEIMTDNKLPYMELVNAYVDVLTKVGYKWSEEQLENLEEKLKGEQA